MRLLRMLGEAVDVLMARFIKWAVEVDRRSRAGEFGKWPWQKDYGLWPWQRRGRRRR